MSIIRCAIPAAGFQILLAIGTFACLAMAGCSHGPAVGDVSGEVKIDGNVVEAGTIRFSPIDGKTGSGGAEIKNGHYEARHVPVNNFQIEINAVKIAGKAVPAIADGLLPQELIPPQYNTQSKLTYDVKEGDNTADFNLTTK